MINCLKKGNRAKTITLVVISAAWVLLLFLLSTLKTQTVQKTGTGMVNGITAFIKMMFDMQLSPAALQMLNGYVWPVLLFACYAMLVLIIWYTLRVIGFRHRRAVILSFACAVFIAVANELNRLFVPGRMPRLSYWLLDCIGAFTALMTIVLLHWMWYKFPRILNRETVSYLVFGVLTTIVNIVIYGLCFNSLHIHNLVSNVIAWVVAVLFAYVVNKLFVFRSHNQTMRHALREFALFIGARVLSLAVDELGMWLLVDIQGVNGGLSKILMNVIVLIMNYFFSKRIIFTKGAVSEKAERLDGSDIR